MTDVAPYDHLRPTRADVPDGVYRVVGTGDPVALLRVGDPDGRRTHDGTLVRVDRAALDGFEPAPNPDDDRPASARFAASLDGLAWGFRSFGASLAERPAATAVAVALVAGGFLWDAVDPSAAVPAFTLIVVGSLGLALIAAR